MGTSRARIRRRRARDQKGPFVFPLDLLSGILPEENSEEQCFEEVIEPLLDDLLSARKECEKILAEIDESARNFPLRRRRTAK